MLTKISAALDESVMGLLALAGLSLGFAPFLFNLPNGITQGFEIAKWLIIGIFALEYAVNIALSKARIKFILDPWRILDAAIILVALLSLLPEVSDVFSSTPALRILRLFSMLLFGSRVGHGFQQPEMPPPRAAPQGQPHVTIYRPSDLKQHKSSWADLLQWVAAPTSAWLHASNLSPERLAEIASAADVPHVMIEAALQDSSFPRIEAGSRWTALTVTLPPTGDSTNRDLVLLLVSADSVLSLASHTLDLQKSPPGAEGQPWGVRCALHIIRLALDRNEELTGRLERTVRQLEDLPAIESPDSFFRQTFHLKRALSTAKSDLWRLRGLLEMLADGRRDLPGLMPDHREIMTPLADEADYLYETVDNIREAVLSLIELHINIAAHGTNRFMRLLMIVSTLALIPAVLGGLLGMNLAEAPWPVTLGQVAFTALVLSLGVLYIFLAKGWFR